MPSVIIRSSTPETTCFYSKAAKLSRLSINLSRSSPETFGNCPDEVEALAEVLAVGVLADVLAVEVLADILAVEVLADVLAVEVLADVSAAGVVVVGAPPCIGKQLKTEVWKITYYQAVGFHLRRQKEQIHCLWD